MQCYKDILVIKREFFQAFGLGRWSAWRPFFGVSRFDPVWRQLLGAWALPSAVAFKKGKKKRFLSIIFTIMSHLDDTLHAFLHII